MKYKYRKYTNGFANSTRKRLSTRKSLGNFVRFIMFKPWSDDTWTTQFVRFRYYYSMFVLHEQFSSYEICFLLLISHTWSTIGGRKMGKKFISFVCHGTLHTLRMNIWVSKDMH